MKIAASSYSFAQLIRKGEMTQFETIAKAKEMGFDAIEFVEPEQFADGKLEEYCESLRKEAEKQKIAVSNFTFGADFINGSDGDTKAEIARVKRMIDAAEIAGAKSVRHDVLYSLERCRAFGFALPILAEACREVSAYAAEKGIRTMVENHGFICQDSLRVEQLFHAVNHPNFGLLVDMGNFLCADENPAEAVSRVAPYAFYAHAKDFIVKSALDANPGRGFFQSRAGNYLRGTIVGQGNVPVRQCVRILKKASYDGFIAIEFEGMENALDALEIGLENLRSYIRAEEA